MMKNTSKDLLNIFNNKKDLMILDGEVITLSKENIFKGPRIGLSDKYPDFKNALYRYLIYKDKIKKGRKSLISLT